MHLFGLEGRGFIIALGITVLLFGTIMFYCLRRFAVLENSVYEQGRVLQNVIYNFQNNTLPEGVDHEGNNTELANKLAISAARNLNNTNKIEVSDNDSESCYSDYTTDSESSVNLNNDNIKNGTNGGLADIKIIEIEDTNIESFNLKDISNSAQLTLSSASSIDTSTTESLLDDHSLIDINLDINNSLDMNNEGSKMEIIKNPGNLKKLKVANLRTLVIEKGLLQCN